MKIFLIIVGIFWLIGAIALMLISFEDFNRDISFRATKNGKVKKKV